jgi:hypothetical protein
MLHAIVWRRAGTHQLRGLLVSTREGHNARMKGIYFDPDAKLVDEHYALVYAPRAGRGRFPEDCVTVVASEAAARQGADSTRHLRAAKVVGPARSSEGFRLYYLVTWLE